MISETEVKRRLSRMVEPKQKHYKPDERAKIILEAVTCGDREVCARYSVNLQTLRRWRRELKTGATQECDELRESVREKRRALDDEWAAKVPGCLNACVEFLSSAARQADQADPDAIHAIAGAMKLVAEVAMSWKAIDARISGQAGAAGATDRPVPSGGNVTPIRRTG